MNGFYTSLQFINKLVGKIWHGYETTHQSLTFVHIEQCLAKS